MPKKDPRVDHYIEKAADFAKPILNHIRELVHAGCPEVEETLKWSFPHFLHQGMMCSMAAFKEHCAMGFWKAQLIFKETNEAAMGQFGRITKISDLPPNRVLLAYIQKAAQLNEEGVKVPRRPAARKELTIPVDLQSALIKNRKARATFEAFPYSHKKEYVQWISEAKRDETRASRVKTAMKWLGEGKTLNWRYEKR